MQWFSGVFLETWLTRVHIWSWVWVYIPGRAIGTKVREGRIFTQRKKQEALSAAGQEELSAHTVARESNVAFMRFDSDFFFLRCLTTTAHILFSGTSASKFWSHIFDYGVELRLQ